MAEVQDQENREGDVGGQEVGHVPAAGEEDRIPVGDGQERDDQQRGPGSVRLERGAERQLLEQPVERHRLAEPQVRDEDDDPGDEARDGGDVGEPGEDAGAAVVDVEEAEAAEGQRHEDGGPRHAALGRLAEDARRLAVDGHRVQDARARVAEGVAGGPGRGQDRRVDDVVEAADAGALDAQHEGAGRGVGRARQQLRLVARHHDPDDQRPEPVEDGEAPDEAARRLGDVAPGRDRLAGRERDQLRGRDEGEAGLDEGRPVAEEAARRPGHEVRHERARFFPIPEPGPLMVRATSQHHDNAENNETDDREELDAGEPELGLAKERHGDDVQEQDHEQLYGDPYGHGDGLGPVLEDDGSGCDLGRYQHRVRIPVVVAGREG